MTEQPLAFEAQYITYRHMKTQPVIKIELEIPRESFEKMSAVIGQPPAPGESVWVAVALLTRP